MQIQSIRLYRVHISLKKPFKHATHERVATDNIVIATRLADGSIGYGEGLPRSYVTGETQDDVIEVLKKFDPSVFQHDIQDLEHLIDLIDGEILSRKHLPHDRENNTARCALELSLLDAYCKSFRRNFMDIAKLIRGEEHVNVLDEVRYDGILSLDSLGKTLRSSLKMKLFGFQRLKIKAGSDTESTMRNIRAIRLVVGKGVDLRVDANEAWSLDVAMRMTRKLSHLAVSSLEQPLPHADLAQMKELKKHSPIPLMLDESLCTIADAERAVREQLCDLFNIRLSKCGGFINSLRIAKLAERHGLGYQLGCMVGETGILSAAGRHFATMHPNLRYLEGSYDRHLLRDNIIREDITFRRGGRARALSGAGIGVDIDPAKLEKYTTYQTTLIG